MKGKKENQKDKITFLKNLNKAKKRSMMTGWLADRMDG